MVLSRCDHSSVHMSEKEIDPIPLCRATAFWPSSVCVAQGLFESSDLAGMDTNEPEILREASLGAIGAHALGAMPRMTPRAGSGRFSQSLPSRDGSNSLTPARPSVGADGAAGLVPPDNAALETPEEVQPDIPDIDFDAPAMDEDTREPGSEADVQQDEGAEAVVDQAQPAALDAPPPGVRTAHASPRYVTPAYTTPAHAYIRVCPCAEDGPAPSSSPAKASPVKGKPRQQQDRTKPRKALTKLYAVPDSQDVRLPRAEVRALIRDRSSLMLELPLLADAVDGDDPDDAAADFNSFLRVRAPPMAGRDVRTERFFRALAAGEPVPRAVWAHGECRNGMDVDDEIEDVAASPVHTPPAGPRRGAVRRGASPAEDEAGPSRAADGSAEQLRDAEAEGQALPTPDFAGSLPAADVSPDAGVPTPGTGQPPLNEDLDAPAQPDPVEDFDMPQFQDEDIDAMAVDVPEHSDQPGLAAGQAFGEEMNTDNGLLATQGEDSQGAEDNSLHAHTVATLARLERMATVRPCSLQRWCTSVRSTACGLCTDGAPSLWRVSCATRILICRAVQVAARSASGHRAPGCR